MDPATWRDRQLAGFKNLSGPAILQQEQVMLDYVLQFPQVRWLWYAPKSKFYDHCLQKINIVDHDYTGVIIFGLPVCDTKTLIDKISKFVTSVDHAYVGVNRYQITAHTLDVDLPNAIEDSLDKILQQCHPEFKRLCKFSQVDGNHMVYSHPMDCYGLCK